MKDYLSKDYKWWGQVYKVADRVAQQRRRANVFARKVSAKRIQGAYRSRVKARSTAATKIQAMVRRAQAKQQYKVLQHVRDVEKGYRAMQMERKFPPMRNSRIRPWRATDFWNRKYPKHVEERKSYAQHLSERPRLRRAYGASYYKLKKY
jgi:hypothetical protein